MLVETGLNHEFLVRVETPRFGGLLVIRLCTTAVELGELFVCQGENPVSTVARCREHLAAGFADLNDHFLAGEVRTVVAEGLCIGKDVQGQVAAGVGRGTQNKSGIQELNVGVRVGILVSKNCSKVGGSEGG